MTITKSKIITYSMSMVVASFFVGCGGGGGSSTTTTSPTTYSISGTVPGTLIEAYCSDGSYYSTTSIDNGTSEHPFSLELPTNLECKLVMITNETASDPADYIITPIEIESDGSTGTYLKIDKDIELGNVPLETPTVNSGWTPGVRIPLKVIINGQTLTVKTLVNDPMDDDNDGILNVYEDDDNDRQINKYDEDDNDEDSSSSTIVSTTLPSSFVANDGRLLEANVLNVMVQMEFLHQVLIQSKVKII